MNKSTYSPGDSPAKTSAPQEKASESGGSGRVFGSSSLVLLGNYDPDTSSLKTARSSEDEDSTRYLDRLPRSGMMRNGTVYQREPLAPLTRETGSGLWPTPLASSGNGVGRFGTGGPNPQTKVYEEQKKLFPTPTTKGLDGGSSSRAAAKKAGTWIPSGRLNPTWVEWLMGFPLGWTDLDA